MSPTIKFYSITVSPTTALEGHTWLGGQVVRLPCSADVEMSRTGDCRATVTDKWGCTVYSVKCTVYCVQCTEYSIQCTLYTVQCTLYSVHCTMYSKEMLLILWREPQCSSVLGENLFLGSCFASPLKRSPEQLSGTSKWSKICLSGTRKWSEIWLLGTPK